MPTALLVDDKEENLYLLGALLGGHGYQIQLAHHGAEALALAHRQPPDLVISDVLMPVMDGFTLCRRWQEDPRLREIPFVFYTATYTDANDEQLAMSLGAARFIIKPKEPGEFMALINAVLEEHRRRTLRPPGLAPASEEQYLRQYNAALVRKLESKLAQLEDKAAFNRAVFDAMNAPLGAIAPDGQILAINRAWSHWAARPGAPEVLRLKVGDNALSALAAMSDGENARTLQAGLREILEDRSANWAMELAYGSGDAAQYFRVHIERTSAAGTGAVIACIDVTEIRRAEKMTREASARKDEFLAVLGHELRNPLGAIKTATDVLNRLDLRDPRAGRSAKVIERQTTNLVRIVNDLLDVSRIARGLMAVEREPTNWVELVRSSAEDVRSGFESRGVALDVKTPREPIWVSGDATRLAQVINNLLGNAQKFTERGDRVEVSVELEASRGWSTLRIADDGAGMTPQTLARLFEPFEQAPQSAARTRGGLGLGLALVRGLVDLHGGEVRAQSAGPGQGSLFVVRLPTTEAPAVADRSPEAVAAVGAKVLIIEDNRDAADVLRTLLEVAGTCVAVAYDGASGIRLARQSVPETIVCDIGLPGALDGYGVARALRADPAFRSTQLVAVTGYGQAEDVRRAREAGFDLHLTKPVNVSDLLSVIARSHEQALGGAA